MSTILGLSASLRGARNGKGLQDLCASLKNIHDREGLQCFISAEVATLLSNHISATRSTKLPDKILKLEQAAGGGRKGLSNSEAALTAALWGASQEGADIIYCNLARYFPESGNNRYLDELEQHILSSDGILLAGPVYFGDRGSLAQEFIEFLSKRKKCLDHIRNKIYGGIAVGAKRNGGQETTLVYQLVDFVNYNMLGVGNDSASTSQYGGTVVAGDLGTADKDNYGINTSIDTGRRIAKISQLLNFPAILAPTLSRSVNIEVWLVQDEGSHDGRNYINEFLSKVNMPENVSFKVRDLTDAQVHRCIACDICPIGPGDKEEYRCIVTKSKDLFVREHHKIIKADAILLAAYSPVKKLNVKSIYQKFIERTRYLRRDDYVIGDILVAPFIISEINSNQNLHIRMITSLIRHHTIIHHPVLLYKYEDNMLNHSAAKMQMESFIDVAVTIAQAKEHPESAPTLEREYNPLGYIISAEMKKKQKERD